MTCASHPVYTLRRRRLQLKTRENRGQGPYVVLASADDDAENWLKQRQTLLTATDLPSVLGIPGARSALETWYQKKDALVARAESDAIREAKQAGHDFEDSNALMFSGAASRHVERSQQLIRSNAYPWLGCTLDYRQHERLIARFIEGKNLDRVWQPLELKNAGSHAADEMWPTGGEPHLTWQVQVHVQMICMEATRGSLSAWLGSPYVHHRWCDIARDEKLDEIILTEGAAFWKSLKRKTPPSFLDDPKVAYAVLRRLDPKRATQKFVSLPKEAQMIDARIQGLAGVCDKRKEEYDHAKTLLEQEKAKLAALIGENAGGRFRDGVTWTFKHVTVPSHTVAGYSYRTLNRVSAQASKPRRTTWKTSK